MKPARILIVSLLLLSILLELSAQEKDRQLIDQFRWQDRLLLVFAPSIENVVFSRADKTLKENNDGVVDRDLKIIYFFEKGQSIYGDSIINPNTAEYFREKYYAAKKNTTFILIGKDGGEKMRNINQFSVDRLFNRIDELPMRRSEIEERTFSFDSIKFE